MLNKDAVDVLLEAVNAKNTSLKTPLNKHNVTVSAVKELDPTANAGMDAEVTITAVANGPFTGALTFQYARADINAAYGRTPQVDITDLATVGQDFATGIETAPGAASLPLSSELTLNVAAASENFSETELPAFHADAAKSHIWKEGAAAIKIRSRILPPPAPQEMLKLVDKDIAGLPNIMLSPKTVHSNDGAFVNSFYANGKVFSINVKTGQAVEVTPKLNGVAVTANDLYLTESLTPVLISRDDKKVYYFGNDLTDEAVTELTTTSDITSVDFSQFTIPLYDSNNDYSVILSNKGNLLLDLGLAHNGTYTVSEVTGGSFLSGELLNPETVTTNDAGMFMIASTMHNVFSITPFDANTIAKAFDFTAYAVDIVSMSLIGGVLYIGGEDGAIIKQPVSGSEPETVQLPNMSGYNLFVFDTANDRIYGTVNINGTVTIQSYKLSDGKLVESKVPTFYPAIKYFNTTYRGISQYGLNIFNGTNKLVQVDFTLDHELTGNA